MLLFDAKNYFLYRKNSKVRLSGPFMLPPTLKTRKTRRRKQASWYCNKINTFDDTCFFNSKTWCNSIVWVNHIKHIIKIREFFSVLITKYCIMGYNISIFLICRANFNFFTFFTLHIHLSLCNLFWSNVFYVNINLKVYIC